MGYERWASDGWYLLCVPSPDDRFHEIFRAFRDSDKDSGLDGSVFRIARLRVGVHAPDWDPPGGTLLGLLPPIPIIVHEALSAIVASGVVTGCYQLLKAWIDARNGRRLKIRVGDIEVEATQMKEEDVLRIFELLQKTADQKQMRELLLGASHHEISPSPPTQKSHKG